MSCRPYLKALDLDELLESVLDVEVAILVVVANISSPQPAVSVDHVGRGLRVLVVPQHHLHNYSLKVISFTYDEETV